MIRLTWPTAVPVVVSAVAVAVAITVALDVFLAAPGGDAPITPTPPSTSIGIYGRVTDAATGRPVEGVCVTIGVPGSICWATTDENGNYAIDGAGVIQPSQTEWELYFHKGTEYPAQASDRFRLPGGVVRVDRAIHR